VSYYVSYSNLMDRYAWRSAERTAESEYGTSSDQTQSDQTSWDRASSDQSSDQASSSYQSSSFGSTSSTGWTPTEHGYGDASTSERTTMTSSEWSSSVTPDTSSRAAKEVCTCGMECVVGFGCLSRRVGAFGPPASDKTGKRDETKRQAKNAGGRTRVDSSNKSRKDKEKRK